MTALFIIIGILLIAGGFSCIFTPLLTYMSTGYYIVILIVAFGIIGIIRSIVQKRFGISFAFDILSVLLGAAMLAFPAYLLAAESVMLMMTAIWFIVMGIVTIISSITVTKAAGSKLWVLQLIVGILDILVGGYAIIHPTVLAIAQGVLIGIFFIETGFTLIFSGIAVED